MLTTRDATRAYHPSQRAPELRLFLTSAEPVALPGVATRQVALSPMGAREAARLFKALAPRPITRSELGCDDPSELKTELQRLIDELGDRLPGLDEFQVRPPPSEGVGSPQPLRVQWRLPSLRDAAALQSELNAHSTLLQASLPRAHMNSRASV